MKLIVIDSNGAWIPGRMYGGNCTFKLKVNGTTVIKRKNGNVLERFKDPRVASSMLVTRAVANQLGNIRISAQMAQSAFDAGVQAKMLEAAIIAHGDAVLADMGLSELPDPDAPVPVPGQSPPPPIPRSATTSRTVKKTVRRVAKK